LLAAALTSLVLASALQAWARPAADRGRLVFVGGNPRNPEGADLFVVDGDGSGLRRLARTAQREWHPTPSPDGRTLAFIRGSNRKNTSVLTMPVDGGRVRRVAHGSDRPAWAPDGCCLAFVRWHAGFIDIARARRDGTQLRRLYTTTDGIVTGVDWSPDGREILFTRTRKRGTAWLVPATGGEAHTVDVDFLGHVGGARWSPVVPLIAAVRIDFDAIPPVTYLSLFDEGGAVLRNVVQEPTLSSPAWSPDGNSIAYAVRDVVWVIGSGGGTPRQLARVRAPVVRIEWSPSGARIALATRQALYVVDAGGSLPKRLTTRLVASSFAQPQFAWLDG
jgi:Tol biopolymer transport system component